MNGPPTSPLRVPFLAASLLLALWASTARGEERAGLSFEAKFSAGEALRGRRPAALRVDVSNRGASFEGRLRFNIKGRSESRIHPVKIPTNSVRRFFLPLDPGSPGFLSGELSLETEGGDETGVPAQTLRARVSGRHCLLGVVGTGRVLGLRTLLARESLSGQNLRVSFPPSEFPDLWEGLAPLDVLFLWGADFQNLSGVQVSALRNWVMRGGLLVALTDSARTVWVDTFVSATLGLEIGAAVTERGSSDLSRLAGQGPWGDPGSFERVRAAARRGRTKARQGPGPLNHLVVRGGLGRGSVMFVAFDPCARGLMNWKGLPGVWRSLLEDKLAEGKYEQGESHWNRSDWFITRTLKKKTAPLSVLFVIAAIILYAALIGPVEFVLWKITNRHHWTLLSFPLVVILASAAAVAVTLEVRGREVTQSEVQVEDIDPETGDSVWETYMGLYSPSPGKLELETGSGGFLSEIRTDEVGIAGKRDLPVAFLSPGRLEARLPVAGTRFFRACGATLRPEVPLSVSVKETRHYDEYGSETGRPDYRITVRNGLPHGLSSCAIVAGRFHPLKGRVFLLGGSLGPGEERTFSSKLGQIAIRNLEPHLARMEDGLDDEVPDPQEVFPYLSFFEPNPTRFSSDRESIRRGLHLGDPLHVDGAAYFVAWSTDEPLQFTGRGWSPQATLQQKLVRMRIADQVDTE